MSEPPGLGALPRAITTGLLLSSGRRAGRRSVFAVRQFSPGRTEVEVDSEMEGRGIGNREWGVRSE
jgi:hypothetical protein